jgi:UDP-glucose 4-epimerase
VALGRAINVGGGGEPTSVNALLAMIADRVGVVADPVHTVARSGDIRRSMADVSLARDLLGFRPAVDISEGISRTVEWFRAERGAPADA